MTVWRCWWLNYYAGGLSVMLLWLSRKNGHQHIQSPTFVTNIYVASSFRFKSTLHRVGQGIVPIYDEAFHSEYDTKASEERVKLESTFLIEIYVAIFHYFCIKAMKYFKIFWEFIQGYFPFLIFWYGFGGSEIQLFSNKIFWMLV